MFVAAVSFDLAVNRLKRGEVMAKLKVCFSMFVDEGRRDAAAAELVKRYEASGKNFVRSQDKSLYGVIDKGVLYVRRIFPVKEIK